MLNHPDFVLAQAKMHQDELIAEAAQHRLLKLAREWRRACRADSADRAASRRAAASVAGAGPIAAAPAAALAGTLAGCGRHVAGSAR
jgi:hypothetical protein